MVNHMHHRIFEQELRRGRLVEAILRVWPMVDVFNAQNRIRIPELIWF